MNPALKIHTTTQAPGPLNGVCQIPGSKSLTNRALVLAALASKRGSCRLNHALASEDTEVMVEGLKALGWQVDAQWKTGTITVQRPSDAHPNRLIPASRASIHVVNSGTTMRFLTGLCSLGTGSFTLDGIERMRERPLGDMIEALKKLGVDVQCPMKAGCPPVVISSTGWNATEVSVGGEVSSQFVSGLLLAAPWCGQPIKITIEGSLVSEPYVDMTIALVRRWGANITVEAPGRYCVEPSDMAYREEYSVEPDASAASYFWGAAAITGGSVTIPGLSRTSLQGDVAFVDVLEKMGCEARFDGAGITVSGRASRGVHVDMNAISDTVMTLAVVALFAEGPTTMHGIGHIRHKETDRISAVATELTRLGAHVEEKESSLTIYPGNLKKARVQTYRDHRMAMSLALVGLRVPGIEIEDPGCVVKTYPGFFNDLDSLIARSV
jgi:3-phosphoshikimate 1-carboxyvinyltransferase